MRVVRAVETPEVQDKAETRADAGGPERRDIALQKSDLHSGLAGPLARGAQSFATISTPVTCQPRRASATDCIPVPQPRSSASP